MAYLALSAGGPHACGQCGGLDPGRLWDDRPWPDVASIVYLYVRLCRRWPIAGWLAFGFFAGLFGWQRPVYVHTEVTVDDEGNEVTVYDDNCDAATDDTYYDDGGGSSDLRGD